MIFDPAGGWGRAADSARSLARVLFIHLIPLLLLGCVAEGYGMIHWGKRVGNFGTVKFFTLAETMPYQVCQFGIALVVVCVGAVVLRHLGNTFHARQTFTQALAVSTFGLGPVFLMRVFDAFASANPWVTWIIGAVLTMAILYQGIPRVMRLDPSHALGVYMSSMAVLVLASGIGRMVVLYCLQEKLLGLPKAFRGAQGCRRGGFQLRWRHMTQLEQELHQALLDLDGTVKRMAATRANVDLLPLFARIDELGKQLPANTDPQLIHFIQRKSFEKATLWLEGRKSQITRGVCGN